MKFLLCQNLVYMPAHGGANKSNRMLLGLLAAEGHKCLAITPATGLQASWPTTQIAEMAKRMCLAPRVTAEVVTFTDNSVDVRAVLSPGRLRLEFLLAIKSFDPDWIIVSSEDTFYSLLAAAVGAAKGKVIYLARTTLLLPFGPDSARPDTKSTQRLGGVAKILCVSHFIRGYIEKWAALPSTVVPLSFYGRAPFFRCAHFDQGFITMANPCAVKGIAILLELARSMPGMQFAAVVTWGSRAEDLVALRRLPNITLLSAEDDIEKIFRQSRVFLVPSLWAEGKGEIVIEAMLRGIPVLAADSGGLAEAKLGVDYLLPITPITQFSQEYDERMIPIPLVPKQNIRPWQAALQRLTADREHYEQISSASQRAALEYAKTATIKPFLDTLSGVS